MEIKIADEIKLHDQRVKPRKSTNAKFFDALSMVHEDALVCWDRDADGLQIDGTIVGVALWNPNDVAHHGAYGLIIVLNPKGGLAGIDWKIFDWDLRWVTETTWRMRRERRSKLTHE